MKKVAKIKNCSETCFIEKKKKLKKCKRINPFDSGIQWVSLIGCLTFCHMVQWLLYGRVWQKKLVGNLLYWKKSKNQPFWQVILNFCKYLTCYLYCQKRTTQRKMQNTGFEFKIMFLKIVKVVYCRHILQRYLHQHRNCWCPQHQILIAEYFIVGIPLLFKGVWDFWKIIEGGIKIFL